MSHDAAFMSAVRGQAARLDNRAAHPRLCIVSDVDPDNHLLRVTIKPGNALSGWMPYSSIGVGAVKISIPPSPGDQAHVTFPHGDSQTGIVSGLLYSTQSAPAASPVTNKAAQPGELLITGPGGAVLHMSGGGWEIHGDVKIVGELTVTKNIRSLMDIFDVHGALNRLRQAFNKHRHRDSRGDTSVSLDAADPE